MTWDCAVSALPAPRRVPILCVMDTEFSDVIPLLVCADIEAQHDFLVKVLGFQSAGIERLADGRVVHAEVRAGSRRFWLHRIDEAGKLVPPARLGAASGGIVVHVDDVDAHHDRVRATGAEILSEPTDQDYGQREYGVRDPEGHVWWIATPTRPPAIG
jgi:MerR family transcriptional regulator, thiopeptide resistance regulator